MFWIISHEAPEKGSEGDKFDSLMCSPGGFVKTKTIITEIKDK